MRGGDVVSSPKKSCAIGAIFFASLAFSGCSEPEGIMTAAPPGVDPRTLVEIKEAEEPQAIGEAGPRSKAAIAPKIAEIPLAAPAAKGEVKTTESGVKYETVKQGSGTVAKAGSRVTVQYIGTLEDGRKFDSSRDRDKPFEFTVGKGDVIPGWEEGVAGMKMGEIRKLIIPPAAAYGAQGKGPVPPNATLQFEIELLNVQ
jgi:FKBP-type peptidyl-prolyl cis-trans isomerase